MKERRQFTRILFSTPAQLEYEQQQYHCELLDISLHGALITKDEQFNIPKNSRATLTFTLPDSTINIEMMVHVCHIEDDHLGLKCRYIDLDSISHLKRLIELNLADEALLHRELSQLIHLPEN